MRSDAEKSEQVEKIRQRAQKKVSNFSELFRSPVGQEVLQDLKDQFDPPVLATGEDNSTIIRASQRDVIRWIEDAIMRGNSYAVEG